MPTSHEIALQQRCQQIVTSPVLSPEQKRHFLALEAENNRRTNRAMSYPITPVFWRTVPNGWSWKARKILMMHSLC